MPLPSNDPRKVWIAFIAVSIVWGTTYYGIRICVKYFPPFFFSGLRHFSAGIIFLIYFFLTEKRFQSYKGLIHIAIAGFLMICGGNALLSWGEKYISSGLTGVLSTAAPIYVTLISIFVFKGFRITPIIIAGTLLSVAGIFWICEPNIKTDSSAEFWWGITLTMIANFLWAAGAVYMRKFSTQQPVALRVAVQMIPASLINFVISFIFEPKMNWSGVSVEAWWSFIYLVLIGSCIGYLCFVYLIQYWQPARVTIHVYINTIVAVVIGWLFDADKLTIQTWCAIAVVLCGVILVNKEYMRMTLKTMKNEQMTLVTMHDE